MIDLDSVYDALSDFSLILGDGYPRAERPEDRPSKLVFGTVVRAAPIDEGGELVVLDWEDKTVETTVPIRPRDPTIDEDPNPRGNGRGCRGIRWTDGHVVAATYHTLERYDVDLNRVDAISDGLMVGLHEIELTAGGTAWVTSTAIDGAVEYDLEEGKRLQSIWPREMHGFQDTIGVEPLNLNKEADNRLRFLDPSATDSDHHLHLNALEVHDGSLYALFNAYGLIADLTNGDVVLRHERLQGGHNLDILDDGIAIVNDSFGKAVRFYDLEQGRLKRTIDLTHYEWVRELIRSKIPAYWGKEVGKKLGVIDNSVAKPLFVRGLVRRDDMLFVGVSPAAILQINWHSGELVDAYQYSSDVHVCVHGLDVIE